MDNSIRLKHATQLFDQESADHLASFQLKSLRFRKLYDYDMMMMMIKLTNNLHLPSLSSASAFLARLRSNKHDNRFRD